MPLDIAASLTSSLSGPLTDYIVREQLHTGTREPVWSAKVCYQQKFQEGQQKLCLSEMRLREAEEKLVKMDQITNDRETCLATMEVYSRLEKIVTKKSFSSLPGSVQEDLLAGPSPILPRAFSAWWVLWNHIDPSTYPLPNSLCRCGDPPEETFFMKAHFIDYYGQETRYGVAIRIAWGLIPEVDRDLMLFSWAARQDYRRERLDFARPKPTLHLAFDMIERDLEHFPQLQYRALSLIFQYSRFA